MRVYTQILKAKLIYNSQIKIIFITEIAVLSNANTLPFVRKKGIARVVILVREKPTTLFSSKLILFIIIWLENKKNKNNEKILQVLNIPNTLQILSNTYNLNNINNPQAVYVT